MPHIPNIRSAKPPPVIAQGKSAPDAAAVDAAFAALKTYDRGSSRAALLPIDEAVMACADAPAARKKLEQRLIAALTDGGSVVAGEYLCSKLTLIGSAHCVPALAARLSDPQLATAARIALEVLPVRQADKALRDNLPELDGLLKVGVIQSLGMRRDPESVRALTALLRSQDLEIVSAAAAALGEIASTRAAKALREFLPRAPAGLRGPVADAALVCAERLLASGRKSEARALCQSLAGMTLPKHIQDAAHRGLEQLTR
jgi:HEAT repeat protein